MLLWVVNVPVKHRIKAESSGLTIQYKVYSPLGLFKEGVAEDRGDGSYEVSFTPNMDGTWIIEYVFPDGFIVRVAIHVLPSPRLLVKGSRLSLYCQAESSGLTVVARIIKPDGTVTEVQATDMGNGLYMIQLDLDQAGAWLVDWVFPDGYNKVVVVPVFEKTPEEVKHEEILDMLRGIYALVSMIASVA